MAIAPRADAAMAMAPRFLTILTGHNLPKIRQSKEPELSIINEKSIAGFTRGVEQTRILVRWRLVTAQLADSSSAP